MSAIEATNLRAGLLALVLIIPFMALGGGGPSKCGAPSSLIQCGSNTISITAGALAGSKTITFSPAFASVPFVTISPSVGPGTISTGNLEGELKLLSVESLGQTWAPFPSALTEVFGDANGEHEAVFNPTGFQQFRFEIVCPADLIITGTETLKPQYNTGSGWVDLSSGNNNIVLANGGSGGGICAVPGPVFGLYENIPVGLAGSINALFRVVGFGGDDVASSVTLTQITIRFLTTSLPNSNVYDFWYVASASLVTVNAKILITSTSTITLTFNWRAAL